MAKDECPWFKLHPSSSHKHVDGLSQKTPHNGGRISSPLSIPEKSATIALLEMRSFAPTPSLDKTVARPSTGRQYVGNAPTSCLVVVNGLQGSRGNLGCLGHLLRNRSCDLSEIADNAAPSHRVELPQRCESPQPETMGKSFKNFHSCHR